MTKDESRRMFSEATQLFDDKQYAGALALLDTVDEAHPDSRHVNYHRALCLVELGRVDEARRCLKRLTGRIKPKHFQKLTQAIEKAEGTRNEANPSPHEDLSAAPEGESVFTVQKVYPVNTHESSVTGIVKKGVFHVNDVAKVISRSGVPVPAPIMRIGPADTPLLLAREGQQAMLLLRVASDKINNGAYIVCTTRSADNRATMVAKPDDTGQICSMECPDELAPIKKMIRRGAYYDAEKALKAYIEQHPATMFAKRMLAQVYLEDTSPLRDPAKALPLIQQVYEAGGASDLTVTNMLVKAQAKSGKPDIGLHFLERLYASQKEMEAKRGLAQRIHDFRMEYELGDLWEFADSYGDIIFKSTNPEEVVRAIAKGIVPLECTCRLNAIGEFAPIETTLAPLYPEVAALFTPKTQQWNSAFLALLILLILGIVLALLLPGILR